MKRFLLLVFIASFLFAIEPVQRAKTTGDDRTSKGKTEVVTSEKVKKSKSEKEKDSFIDVDSNSVNDQREHDLQKIKLLKSKFKDLFKKKTKNTPESRDKQDKPQKNKHK